MQYHKRVQRIIDKVRGGERLCYGLRQAATDEPLYYWLEPSGIRIPSISAEDAIRTGQLIPQMDGLFPDQTQTFVAR